MALNVARRQYSWFEHPEAGPEKERFIALDLFSLTQSCKIEPKSERGARSLGKEI